MADVWVNSMHVIPESPPTFQSTATWRIQCDNPRLTCYITGCCHRANSTACHPRATYYIAGCCHLVNSLAFFSELHATLQGAVNWRNQFHDRATLQGVIIPSAILNIVFRYILFFNAVSALTRGGFRIVSDTLVCFSVCRQNTKMQFSQKLSNLELWCLLTTYRKSYMGFSENPLLDP